MGYESLPTAVGQPVGGGSTDTSVPTVTGHFIDMPPPSVPTFEVRVPGNMGPGSQFGFQVNGQMHTMIVPVGAAPNMLLRCMFVPRGVMAGSDVVVSTPEGDMAVTIPHGMQPGEVLVVDLGESLQQWVAPEEGCCEKVLRCWSPVCEVIIELIRRFLPFCVCLLLLTMLAAMMGFFRPHHPYGGRYGGNGYYASPQPVNNYNQHILNTQDAAYGVSPPAPPIDAETAADFPGKEEGFERGTDDSGNEGARRARARWHAHTHDLPSSLSRVSSSSSP